MFLNRLRKNHRHRQRWAKRSDVHAWRVYDRDIPEIPLAVDLYGDALYISHFLRATADAQADASEERWLAQMAEAAAGLLQIEPAALFIKQRERQRGSQQYTRLGHRAATRVVREAGLRFEVNLSDYLDTGLFLDHRQTRALVAAEAAGQRMLNLYAYTGSFSVYAAHAGALSTTTVDLSNSYLDWTARNFALNTLPTQSPQHRRVRADTFDFLAQAAQRGERYDLVVVDPPTFSNSKAMARSFDIQRDHAELLRAVRRVCAPGARVWFSTNRRRFQLDEGLQMGAGWAEVAEITARTVPPDFVSQRPHRCWRLVSP